MKTLIVYDSKTGVVGSFAEKLGTVFRGAEVQKLSRDGTVGVPVEDFDRVIVGGSVHAGQLQSSVKRFCNRNLESLRNVSLGLFLCELTPPEEAEHYFSDLFSQELVTHASALGLFGGAVYFEKLNFLERFIMKKISKRSESFEHFHKDRWDRFVSEMTSP